MNIEITLKSRSYILDLDHVKLSLGIFFFLSCSMEIFFTDFRIYLYCCQKQTPKSWKFYMWQRFPGGSLECNIQYLAALSVSDVL